MAIIAPAVLADGPHGYREQVERVQLFAERVHIDVCDGVFAPTTTIGLEQLWLPEEKQVDVHLMYQNPEHVLARVVELKPNLVIIHAEAEGNFQEISDVLRSSGIKVGLAVLPQTSIEIIRPAFHLIDHVLIFSGDLGRFGGKTDLSLLGKIGEVKEFDPMIEIGWDGGINEENVKTLVHNGVQVLDVGGFIQKSSNPSDAYATLKGLIENKDG